LGVAGGVVTGAPRGDDHTPNIPLLHLGSQGRCAPAFPLKKARSDIRLLVDLAI
jgi:hypothetical protein